MVKFTAVSDVGSLQGAPNPTALVQPRAHIEGVLCSALLIPCYFSVLLLEHFEGWTP